MITKAAIKYKFLEWALETLVSKIFISLGLIPNNDRFRIGQQFKQLLYHDGAILYDVTVVSKGDSNNMEDGYHFVYKYVKYPGGGDPYVCFSFDDTMESMSEDEFMSTHGFKNSDIFDDLDLYLEEWEIQKSKFIP